MLVQVPYSTLLQSVFPNTRVSFSTSEFFTLNSKVFRINVWIAHTPGTAQILSGILSFIFQCSPMKKVLLPTLSGRCINDFQWTLATLILSVIIDVYITLR
ncbi:hypothetical protein ABVK25_002406 [Lepraria finkii]|uniref:Rhodopsin domain-containing protein n=1 Tax=Lepraria finkii TaxID=1340010 RepID=A0ABR4BN30_9LECA